MGVVYLQPTNINLQFTVWSQPCSGCGWVGLRHAVKAPRPLCEGTLRSLEKGPTK